MTTDAIQHDIKTAVAKKRGTFSRVRKSARERLVWWEAVVLVRKAGIVLLAVLVSSPNLQTTAVIAWLLLFWWLHLMLQPFEKPLFNVLESLSLAAAVLTAMVSSLLLQFNVVDPAFTTEAADVMSPWQWTVTVVLVALNACAFATLVGAWLYLRCRGPLQKPLARMSSRASLLLEKGRGNGSRRSILTSNAAPPLASSSRASSVSRRVLLSSSDTLPTNHKPMLHTQDVASGSHDVGMPVTTATAPGVPGITANTAAVSLSADVRAANPLFSHERTQSFAPVQMRKSVAARK